MEDDEDDFYGGGATTGQGTDLPIKREDDPSVKMSEDQDEGEEDEDEEDSDDDVKFTLERPQNVKEELAPALRTRTESTPLSDRPIRPTSTVKQEQRSSTSTASPAAAPAAVKSPLTYNGKEGKDFPKVRTSQLDIDAIPTWPGNGKPITEVDIDADLAENSKPWRQPGTDQTDFFNYGFDEYTWAQYCVRQQTMSNTISEAKQADAQMKAMLGGGGSAGGGNGPGAGGGGGIPEMPAMMGMPAMDDSMAQMMQQAVQSGVPFEQFMQIMGGGGMPMNMPQAGGGFGGGSGQNSASPHPQAGQGFQPPTGPAAQSGMGDGMDGFSSQQMTMMQQQQQQQQGGVGGQGGGRRNQRGRGRGFY